jgi:hypothetical protein
MTYIKLMEFLSKYQGKEVFCGTMTSIQGPLAHGHPEFHLKLDEGMGVQKHVH